MFIHEDLDKYETVKGDPLKTKIYTLDNGLKVYMSVNKETPRLQTYIAVRVGSKDDPHETTGLSHYLEHLMFKGTESFGTSNYEAEKPLLDEIRNLFEVYRTKTDPEERLAIYHQIDSISYEASKIAIPNEYDKLMSIIGASGSNAFTSSDMTVYQEDIPSNQIENWAPKLENVELPITRGTVCFLITKAGMSVIITLSPTFSFLMTNDAALVLEPSGIFNVVRPLTSLSLM